MASPRMVPTARSRNRSSGTFCGRRVRFPREPRGQLRTGDRCERAHNFVNAVFDEPQGSSNSIASVWQVVNLALALARLNGRNHETWDIRDVPAASDLA
jgi:hypothetical protein